MEFGSKIAKSKRNANTETQLSTATQYKMSMVVVDGMVNGDMALMHKLASTLYKVPVPIPICICKLSARCSVKCKLSIGSLKQRLWESLRKVAVCYNKYRDYQRIASSLAAGEVSVRMSKTPKCQLSEFKNDE